MNRIIKLAKISSYTLLPVLLTLFVYWFEPAKFALGAGKTLEAVGFDQTGNMWIEHATDKGDPEALLLMAISYSLIWYNEDTELKAAEYTIKSIESPSPALFAL